MKIFVIGIGPGGRQDMTQRAVDAIEQCDVIYGYSAYVDLAEKFFPHKKFERSFMMQEVERCKAVADKAAEGFTVGLISSGDSGIYGMAGIMLEVLHAKDRGRAIDIEVVPGITSALSAAAILGAPIMHDFAVISLSDLLTDRDVIIKRLHCVGQGDFVVCLYNPKSKKRVEQIETAQHILLQYKDTDTPVGIVKNASREGEQRTITTLGAMLTHHIDMFTVIIIGNSKTYVKDQHMITPRGYVI